MSREKTMISFAYKMSKHDSQIVHRTKTYGTLDLDLQDHITMQSPKQRVRKPGETVKCHYFVNPVTCFLSGEVLSIFIRKPTSVNERNLKLFNDVNLVNKYKQKRK